MLLQLDFERKNKDVSVICPGLGSIGSLQACCGNQCSKSHWNYFPGLRLAQLVPFYLRMSVAGGRMVLNRCVQKPTCGSDDSMIGRSLGSKILFVQSQPCSEVVNSQKVYIIKYMKHSCLLLSRISQSQLLLSTPEWREARSMEAKLCEVCVSFSLCNFPVAPASRGQTISSFLFSSISLKPQLERLGKHPEVWLKELWDGSHGAPQPEIFIFRVSGFLLVKGGGSSSDVWGKWGHLPSWGFQTPIAVAFQFYWLVLKKSLVEGFLGTEWLESLGDRAMPLRCLLSVPGWSLSGSRVPHPRGCVPAAFCLTSESMCLLPLSLSVAFLDTFHTWPLSAFLLASPVLCFLPHLTPSFSVSH